VFFGFVSICQKNVSFRTVVSGPDKEDFMAGLPKSGWVMIMVAWIAGCGVSTDATVSDFSRPEVIRTEFTDLRLARISQIQHRIVRKTVATGKYFFDSNFYDVEFPRLTETEFDQLRETYSGWSASKNPEGFRAGRSWTLASFLPPAMTAHLEYNFLAEQSFMDLPRIFGNDADGARVKTPVLLLSNCWGSAYEVLREAQTPASFLTLFYAPERLARAFFFDARWSEEVLPVSKQIPADPKVRNLGLRPGDVLVIGDRYLQHIAIFVDDDFYFEKSGAGNTALYRLNTWETIVATWPPDLHGYSWRRFNRAALPDLRTALPSGVDLSVFSEEELKGLTAELNLDDRTGRPLGATWLTRREVPL
jgi:hypothetical protein